jgi:uncharacterized membrane protein YqjE
MTERFVDDPYPSSGATVRQQQAADPRETSVGDLVSQVTSDLSELFRKEVELAKVEIRDEAKRAGRTGALFGGAGLGGYFALLFLSLAAMFGLAEVMHIGWAAVVVGAVYLAVAGILAARARREAKALSPAPQQTIDTLKEDAEWARNRKR